MKKGGQSNRDRKKVKESAPLDKPTGKQQNIFLLMAEMLMAGMIFGLHAVSSAWWGGKRGGSTHLVSFLTATGVTGPIMLLMFRIDPVIHKMGELTKPINLFILIVCAVEYIIGAVLILLDAIGSRYKSYYRDASICTALFSVILAVLLIVDMTFTLKKS
ncbi:uncharacterized protein LOC106673115 isoform X2 [Cimex lectularius]|uniref:Uncharacterized protein n=1 Tax=Cimex lectularius TaxID=79782 RepID=A0A8I6SNS2_CIMLE|nr:uncharacterized protein LOC106673115 isoform X2 [Cimex lectularius]